MATFYHVYNSNVAGPDIGHSHSWALTDRSVTSGTGLTMMPKCRCRTKQYKLHVNVNVHWHTVYIEMPECRTVRHPVSPVLDWEKLTMPKPFRYRTKLTQSGIFLVRDRTKIRDAGMPMPALVSSMPMPSYGPSRPVMVTSKICLKSNSGIPRFKLHNSLSNNVKAIW